MNEPQPVPTQTKEPTKPKAKRKRGEKGKGNFPKKQAFTYYCTVKEDGRLPSYEDVAKKFGYSDRVVEQWGSKLKWVEKREKIGEKMLNAWIEKRAELIKQLDKGQFDNLTKLESLTMKQVDMLTKVADALDGEGDAIQLLRKKHGVSARDLRELAETLKIAHNGKRVIFGLPTEVSKADVTQRNIGEPLPNDDIEKMDNFLNNNAKPASNKTTN